MIDMEKLVWGDTGMPVVLPEGFGADSRPLKNVKNARIASEEYVKRVCLKGENEEGETVYFEAPRWAERADGGSCGGVPITSQELEIAVFQIFCRLVYSYDLIQKIFEALDAKKVMKVILDCRAEQMRRDREARLAREEG